MFHEFSVNENFWIVDGLGEGGSKMTLFQKFFSHGSGKFRTRTILRFTKSVVTENFINRRRGRGWREYHDFPSNVFLPGNRENW